MRRRTAAMEVAACTILAAMVLEGCAVPQRSTPDPAVVSPTQPPSATSTLERPTDLVVRPFNLDRQEYLVTGSSLDDYRIGDPLVVYFREPSGLELIAAVMQVIESNPNNRLAVVTFRNANVDLEQIGTLAALRVDKQISSLSLERLVPASHTFVGFTLKDRSRIRIRSDAGLKANDRLEARRLSSGGNSESLTPPITFTIGRIEDDGNTAIVQTKEASTWPAEGTLLVLSREASQFVIPVADYISGEESGICVQAGDRIEIRADGEIRVGLSIGESGPEGKTKLRGGVIAIDPENNIVRQFQHAVLLYRIEAPGTKMQRDEGWLAYDREKSFYAQTMGCLAFEVNDAGKADNSGAYSVQVLVTP